MNNFLLSSPLINGHFEKMYHTSATARTVHFFSWSKER